MVISNLKFVSAFALSSILTFGVAGFAQTTAPSVAPVDPAERGIRLPQTGANDALKDDIRIYIKGNLQPVFQNPEIGANARVRSDRGRTTVSGWEWQPLQYEMTLSNSEGLETLEAVKDVVNGTPSKLNVTLATFGRAETSKWMTYTAAEIAQVQFPSVSYRDSENALIQITTVSNRVTPESGTLKSKFYNQSTANSIVPANSYNFSIKGLPTDRVMSIDPPTVTRDIIPGNSRIGPTTFGSLVIYVPFSESKPFWDAINEGSKPTMYASTLDYIAKNRKSALKLNMESMQMIGVSLDGTDDNGRSVVRVEFSVDTIRLE